MESTCSSGNTLDWFMVSGGLAIAAETNVDRHSGVRIRRASAFVGLTKKEAKKGAIPERDFKTKEGTLE
eukprot:1448980-Heterocapsa_arctica.AAC.1